MATVPPATSRPSNCPLIGAISPFFAVTQMLSLSRKTPCEACSNDKIPSSSSGISIKAALPPFFLGLMALSTFFSSFATSFFASCLSFFFFFAAVAFSTFFFSSFTTFFFAFSPFALATFFCTFFSSFLFAAFFCFFVFIFTTCSSS